MQMEMLLMYTCNDCEIPLEFKFEQMPVYDDKGREVGLVWIWRCPNCGYAYLEVVSLSDSYRQHLDVLWKGQKGNKP